MYIPKVTIIGSCRVYTTLKYLEESKKIEIHNKSVYGYTHTTSEALQVLENTHSNFVYPHELAPFISKNPKKIGMTKGIKSLSSDIFVIEISSIKLVKIYNTFLKINETSKYLKEYAPFFLSHLHRKKPTRDKLDEEYVLSNSLTQKFIDNLQIIEQEAKSFVTDIKAICSLIPKDKKILFISHFDIIMKDKNIRIPSRVKIVKWLEKFVSNSEDRINMYNPRFLVEEIGIENALDDVVHYKEVFKPILAEVLYKKYFKEYKFSS